jgi:two-component system, OmpR family, response regulator
MLRSDPGSRRWFYASCCSLLKLVTASPDGTFRRARGNTPDNLMSVPRHVLICDEERESRSALAAHLEHHGYRVSVTAGNALTRTLERARIDLVILGVQLGEDGLRAFRGLRAASDVPLVILAHRGDEVDRIVGLEMGADDYLVKPVNPRELLARLRNILRRTGAGAAPAPSRARLFRFDGWRLDSVARQLWHPDGQPAALRSSEYRVLASLLAHGNRVVSRLELIELARGRDPQPFDRSVDVRISRLRQVLGDDARGPRIIKTVHGEGYVIGVPVERA